MKPINRNQTFENFSVNDGNVWAFAALKAVVDNKNYYNPLYIYGKDGVGKSHLLNATINALPRQTKFAFLSTETLSVKVVDNLKDADVDYILIDDLELLHKNVELEEKLSMLIEDKEKQVIVTSNVAPKDLEVSNGLQKRLQWGLTTSMVMVSENQ